MSCVAIITARGGSKRVPGKNVRAFCGRPILAYSVEAALESGLFDEVMVSTDSEEIAAVARRYGAQVPFLRSARTSDDHAVTADVLEEVLLRYREEGRSFDTLCCLYPTAPFVTARKLTDAWRVFQGSGADALMTVVRFSFPPQRAVAVRDGKVIWLRPESLNARSQDLEPIYHDCGQFYFYRSGVFLERRRMDEMETVPFVLPETEVQDIDTEEDWAVAEAKFRVMRGRETRDVPSV